MVSLPLPDEPGRKLAPKFRLRNHIRRSCLLTITSETSGCMLAETGKRQCQAAITSLQRTQKPLFCKILKIVPDDVQNPDFSCIHCCLYPQVFLKS